MKISFSIKRIVRKRGRRETLLQNPERDWRTILIATMFCILGFSLYHLYFYNLVEKGALYGEEAVDEQKDTVLDSERINRVITVIDEREKLQDTLVPAVSRVVDPSE